MAPGQGHATKRAERLLGFCCALVFLLIVTHVVLMASERHTAVMGSQMGAEAPTGAIARLLPHAATHGEEPTAPHHPVLGDCPAQQAVPPLVLLLLLLVTLLRRLTSSPPHAPRTAWSWALSLSLPPPLDPARRRALLQVFLN